MSDIKLQETIRFHMDPDMYGGPECDQMVPRWHCYGVGDKDADHQHEPITLDARRFPPGTRISVKEPMCPQCEETRSPKYPEPATGPVFGDKCRCGFDWANWTANQYA
jgi:hypothetical protein